MLYSRLEQQSTTPGCFFWWDCGAVRHATHSHGALGFGRYLRSISTLCINKKGQPFVSGIGSQHTMKRYDALYDVKPYDDLWCICVSPLPLQVRTQTAVIALALSRGDIKAQLTAEVQLTEAFLLLSAWSSLKKPLQIIATIVLFQ